MPRPNLTLIDAQLKEIVLALGNILPENRLRFMRYYRALYCLICGRFKNTCNCKDHTTVPPAK